MSDPVRFTRRYLEAENVRLLNLIARLIWDAATPLCQQSSNALDEARGVLRAAKSLSEGSTVQGSDKLGTNSEPHRSHSQPHSGTIELPILPIDPAAEARIDALVAAQPKPQQLRLTHYGRLLRQDEVRMVHDAAWDAALEAAAKLLEGTDGWPSPQGKNIAAAIRALGAKP